MWECCGSRHSPSVSLVMSSLAPGVIMARSVAGSEVHRRLKSLRNNAETTLITTDFLVGGRPVCARTMPCEARPEPVRVQGVAARSAHILAEDDTTVIEVTDAEFENCQLRDAAIAFAIDHLIVRSLCERLRWLERATAPLVGAARSPS